VPLSPEQLSEIDLFAGLDRKDLQALANSFKEVTFHTGDDIVSEDKGGVGFFIIESGEAKVTVRGEERATIKAGDHFGEIALIDEGARTATVTAATEVHCFGLTSWAFRPLVEHNPTIAWKLLQIMAKRLRETQQRTI
jgi:CRP/FNR family cyclic AMP-dependent transcriptional regulator